MLPRLASSSRWASEPRDRYLLGTTGMTCSSASHADACDPLCHRAASDAQLTADSDDQR